MTSSVLRLVLILAVSCAAPQAHAEIALTPYPAQMTRSEGVFDLNARTRIYVPADDVEARVVAVQMADLMAHSHGLKLKVIEGDPPAQDKAIVLVRSAKTASPEAYGVTITSDRVTLSSATRQGLFYATMTVWQLALEDKALPALTISDTPRYGWRGMMVDSARHFQTLPDLKRLIDAMAAYKLNTLHWHLVDDQGWRLEIKKYPKLTAVAGWRTPKGASGRDPRTGRPRHYGGFYTQDQVRDLVDYASARNITIVPEIELPGHATAPLTAYPQYGVLGTVPDSGMSDWGVYSNLYNVDDATFGFLTDVLDEVMDLFPSPYIHIGGDEAIKNQWQQSPQVQAKIKALGLKDEHELQSWFIARIGKHLSARGRHLIGWDEILEGGLAPDATVMSWRGLDGAVAAAKLGHDTILTPHPALYLDGRQSLSASEPAGRSEISTLRNVYEFDSTPDDLPPARQHHIIGVQANAWTEHMRNARRLEEMAFPRLTALAEVGWTPELRRDWGRYSQNLSAIIGQLNALGVHYDPVPFEPDMALTADGDQAQARLISPLTLGEMRYTLDGAAPTPASALYSAPLTLALPSKLKAQTFLNGQPLGRMRVYDITPLALNTRKSHDLKTCGDSIPLRLEDDAPFAGPRAIFVISIYKPCWVWEQADLSQGFDVTARIGQAPFNFQLAGGKRIVSFDKPSTSPYGELVIRQRTGTAAVCEGDTVAVIPIPKAAHDTDTLSTLTGRIPPVSGTHDLCFTFNRPSKETLWALDQVTLTPYQK